MVWTHDKSALALVAQEQESSFQQIWYVPYPRGEARRIGNDFESYYGMSLTADDSQMVSVEAQTESNIYVTKASDWEHAAANHTRQRPLFRYFLDGRRPYPIRVRCTRLRGHLDDE